jgi:predicted glutamine amidotransferase
MCNLNIIIRKKKHQVITPFLQSVSSHSYVRNDDGDGIYIGSTGEIFKSLYKMNYYAWEQEIEKSNVVFSFQRLATSGKEVAFVQPFRNEEFIFMHNGVANSFLKDIGSDSWGFFNDFVKEFELLNHNRNSRTVRITKAIKTLLDNRVSDWYSMILYDLVEKKLYYWKNDTPSINFYRYNGLLYITTLEENKKFLNMTGNGKRKEIEIKPYSIYKISPTKKKVRIKLIAKISQPIEINEETIQTSIDEYVEEINGEYCSNCGDEIIEDGQIDKEDNSPWCGSCWKDKQLQEGEEE